MSEVATKDDIAGMRATGFTTLLQAGADHERSAGLEVFVRRDFTKFISYTQRTGTSARAASIDGAFVDDALPNTGF